MAKFKKSTVTEDPEFESVEEEIEALEDSVLGYAETYAGADRNEKAAKKVKDAAKEKFNKDATRLIELTRPLGKKTVETSVESLGSGFFVDEWVEHNHPGYRVADMEVDEKSQMVALVLEEDPALMKFHVVTSDGLVVGRTVSQDADEFDAEGFFRTETDSEWCLVKKEVVEVFTLDEGAAEAAIKEDDSGELLATLQQYTKPGAIKPKMTPVRKANEDD